MAELDEHESGIINALNRLQEEEGFIPQPALAALAVRHGVPEAQLHGLVSFFHSFRGRPAGRHRAAVCCGTACYARGAPLIRARFGGELDLDADGTSPDGFITVEEVQCVGACSRAPILVQDGRIKDHVKSFQVPFLIQELRNADGRKL